MKTQLSHIGTLTLLTGLLLVAFQNCGSSDDQSLAKAAGSSGITAEDLEQRYKAIADLTGADLRCSNSSDCEVLSVGHKPCGGPAGYVVTSNSNSSLAEIQSLLSEYAAMTAQYLAANQVVGTCDYLMPPAAVCQLSQCKIIPSNGI